jgi:radical SAM family uncharacterized protein/radical SAM-linked protein
LDVRHFDHPYSGFLDRVEKPTRYIGREYGVRIKSWDSVATKICLAFPDIYDIGMSHLGYRILYQILNDEPRTLAERCYAPWIDLERELRERRLPLVTLESRRPLRDFDVVGFSLQFELCYSNVLTMLELGGIALRAADRDDAAPLVLAGGPAATHAEPMAPFFDALVIGDGEQSAKDVALTWSEDTRRGLRRHERLERLAQIEGIYVPSLYGTAIDERSGLEVVVEARSANANLPVKRRILANLEGFPFPTTGPVGGPETVFDRLSVEVARGCTEGCRFCQAGMIYRPLRERSPEQVEHAVLTAVRTSGQDEVSLTALSTADVSFISPLIKSIARQTAPERVSLGVASLRAYGLSEDLLDELRKVRAAGLTFAPEAGTQRLRDVINKNISDEQLMETAHRVFSRGWDRMKLYFIAGLPTEADEDLAGIVDIGRRALEVGRRVSRKRVTVTISVSIHVPKPHTPFQWCAMDRLTEVRRKQDLLRELAQKVRGLDLRLHDATASALEGILARGDRRLAPVIERAYRRGARFDSWDDQFRPDLWDEALMHCGIDRSLMLGTIPLDARLPWSHIHVGLDPEFLTHEYRQAMKGRTSPPCGKPVGMHLHHTNVEDSAADPRKLVCHQCGIECDMTRMREERLTHLSSLGALLPESRVKQTPLATPNDSGRDRLPDAEGADDPELHRPVQSGGHGKRFRLRFEKTGPASLLGHLDLIRELPRVFRRAGVRVAYTRGFHPKPALAFAPALSLGVESLDEYVDATLLDAPSGAQLLDALSEASCSGLRFLDVALLPERAPSLSKCIAAAEYAIVVPTSLVEALGGIPVIEGKIAEFMAAESVVVVRHVDRDKKSINVRRFVTRLTIGRPSIGDTDLAARISDDFRILDLVVSCTPSGSAKALEVAQALFGQASRDCRAVRVALLDARGLTLCHRFKSEGFDLSGLFEEMRSETVEVA